MQAPRQKGWTPVLVDDDFDPRKVGWDPYVVRLTGENITKSLLRPDRRRIARPIAPQNRRALIRNWLKNR